jgi:hypothetical protein
MIDTGVKLYQSALVLLYYEKQPERLGPTYANLVHDGDAGILGLLVELKHGGRHVAGGDDMFLVSDGGLDDGGVEGVRDQADDHIVLGNGSIESLVVVDIEGDGSGQLDALGELLGAFESSAG